MSELAIPLSDLWLSVSRRTMLAQKATRDDVLEEGAALDEDRRVVARVLSGDRDAFAEIVERYQSKIADQMRRFSPELRVIEELTHDVFVEAYVSLASYRAKAPLLHWLRRIAVRTGYRFWKTTDRNRRREVCVDALESLASPSLLDAKEASDSLRLLLDLLAARDRLVLTLLYWDGYTADEAARLTGWTATMVRVQAFRARRRLKKLLNEAGYGTS